LRDVITPNVAGTLIFAAGAIVGRASVESLAYAVGRCKLLTRPSIIVVNARPGRQGRKHHQQNGGAKAQSALASD